MPELAADVTAIADRLHVETLHAPTGVCQGVDGWHAGVTVGLHPDLPLSSAAGAAGGSAPGSGGCAGDWAQDGLGATWVGTYARAPAEPGALLAALASYRAATRSACGPHA